MEYNMEELFILVKELSDIYTGKASTSVTYETAQQLMTAVLYCIRENDLEFVNYKAENNIVIDPKHFPSAREAYDNGYRIVTEKIKRANGIYSDILSDFYDYGNRAYYDTLVKGIPEFFKWYDPRLNPMNHIILVDYTVLENIYDLEGVDLIYRYLQCIACEQKFLKQMPETYIREVLIRYHSDYEELLINIPGVILKKILANMLIGVKFEKTEYEAGDYEKMADLVNRTEKEELEGKLSYLLKRLIQNIYHNDLKLYRYLANEIPSIAAEIRNAVKHNTLRNMI